MQLPQQEDHHPRSGMSRPALSIRRSLAADQSSNILELLQVDEGSRRPPSPAHVRVTNLGRTIKERGEVCQWIHAMRREPDAPVSNEVGDSTSASAFDNKTKASGKKEMEETDVTSNAATQQAVGARDRDHRLGPQPQLAAGGGTGDLAEVKASPGLFAIDAGKSGTCSDVTAEEEKSFEEQLDVIRQQQSQLLEQQKVIQEKLDRRQSESTGGNSIGSVPVEQNQRQDIVAARQSESCAEDTLSESISTSLRSTGSMVETKRRRLKGALASQYARRDEGTVGSLLWNNEGHNSTHVSDSTSNAAGAGACVSAGRQANLKQDSSSNISQLLSQTSFLESRSEASELV